MSRYFPATWLNVAKKGLRAFELSYLNFVLLFSSAILHLFCFHEMRVTRCKLLSLNVRGINNFKKRKTILTKNRQSMTARGYCCCYLEHCSKTNHIAKKGVIQRAKYENILDLKLFKSANLKISRIGRQKQKNIFFFFHQKNTFA